VAKDGNACSKGGSRSVWRVGEASRRRKTLGGRIRRCKKAIKENKECFKQLHLNKSATSIESYKIEKRVAKRAVSVANGQMYDDLYQRLCMKEGIRTFSGWLGSERGRQRHQPNQMHQGWDGPTAGER
jgi:hypothetical protein